MCGEIVWESIEWKNRGVTSKNCSNKSDERRRSWLNRSFTLILGPANSLNSRMSSGFCTKERATQSIERVRANCKSLHVCIQICWFKVEWLKTCPLHKQRSFSTHRLRHQCRWRIWWNAKHYHEQYSYVRSVFGCHRGDGQHDGGRVDSFSVR